jgi:hypothetical protein
LELIDLSSAYKSNWRGESNQVPRVGTESLKNSGSMESDPIDRAVVKITKGQGYRQPGSLIR